VCRRWLVGIGAVLLLTCARTEATVAEIWADTFASEAALAVSYSDITDAETNATCGVASGWGVRTTGDASAQYYGFFLYAPGSPTVSEYLRVRITLDHASTAESGYGNSLFELRGSTDDWFVSLYHGVGAGADRSVLEAYSRSESSSTPVASSSTGVIVPESWQMVEMEVWFSTDDGFGGPAADGRIRVTVDGVEAINATGIMVQSSDGFPNTTYSILFGPMGNGDDIGIYDAPVAEATLTNGYTYSGSIPSEGEWANIADFRDIEIRVASFPDGIVHVRGELWTDGVATVQARVLNVTDNVEMGRSSVVTSATPVMVSIPFVLTATLAFYRVQITSDLAATDLFAAGWQFIGGA